MHGLFNSFFKINLCGKVLQKVRKYVIILGKCEFFMELGWNYYE